MTTIVWLRNDLRLEDNNALNKALERGPVQLFYCVHENIIERHNMAPAKINLIKRRLIALSVSCQKLGLPLLVVNLKSRLDIAAYLQELARETCSDSVFWNREYPLDERRRDTYIDKALSAQNITIKSFDDRMIMPPEALLKSDGTIYRVFTAFKNNYHKILKAAAITALPIATKKNALASGQHSLIQDIEQVFSGFEQRDLSDLWPVSNEALDQQINHFSDYALDRYHLDRDAPQLAGTSKASCYLAVGALSPKQVMASVLAAVEVGSLAEIISRQDEFPGAITWLNELLWRDFYQYLMFHRDDLSKGLPFQRHTQAIAWRQGPEADLDFKAWCTGNTGFPIIDAAMRQLLETGWMHNRLRMIVAMFLTKQLLIDWRRGEQFFTEHLIDWDFSANNGGWQWSASTGCDGAPYFRVFNPVTQSERFDPEGQFISHYFPELAVLPKKQRHNPQGAGGYPKPIVDLKFGRLRALEAFKCL